MLQVVVGFLSLVALPSVVKSARTPPPAMGLFDSLLGGASSKPFAGPVVMGTEEMMSPKAHGTSAVPVQKNLRWKCDEKVADNICNFNREHLPAGGVSDVRRTHVL